MSLHTEIRGSGPTLVLLHGWGLNARVWDGLVGALCDRYRTITVDLPGHGRSPWLPERSSLQAQAEQVRATLAPLADEYSLLGWSLGGQIALQLAAGQCAGDLPHPAHAAPRRLVLIATTPRFLAGPDWPHGAPAERLAAQAQGLLTDYRRTVSEFLELQVRGSADGGAALAELRGALFSHGAGDIDSSLAALARGLELLRDTDLRRSLADVIAPTLVIAGQYDRVTLPAASRALAAALPAARYVEIRRAAHAPFLSHLPQLCALLCDFLPRT